MKKVSVVIGKNFGDEGKGLVTDYLCSCDSPSLVIKHNGGAQAGHTVDREKDRFIFHQLSSGSFRSADTFWANTYFPDLYKLGEEVQDFRTVAGFVPKIFADGKTAMVVIDDVLINMAFETMRGNNRHGSCGMGINESFLRTRAGFGITLKEAFACSGSALSNIMKDIRKDYVFPRMERMKQEFITFPAEYEELFRSDAVLENAADEMLRNAEFVELFDPTTTLFKCYDNIVFETGQGLLLDLDYETYAPHLTTSHTGLTNPVALCEEYGLELTDVFYVSRSYVTRHGAGPLPGECAPSEIGNIAVDRTNLENPWQGKIRYGKHVSLEEFIYPVREDLENLKDFHRKKSGKKPRVSLCLTHMNETKGQVCFATQDRNILELCEENHIIETFDGIFVSDSPFAKDIELSWTTKG